MKFGQHIETIAMVMREFRSYAFKFRVADIVKVSEVLLPVSFLVNLSIKSLTVSEFQRRLLRFEGIGNWTSFIG